ncbi:MAG: hypothetical protein H0T44_13325 [Gemmatimonadales bacterium]|nr:hypothetical protein [Gemmatimonadales bacterium]
MISLLHIVSIHRAVLPAALLLALSLVASCAETNAPLPDPQEVLLVVNRTANTLNIVPVDQPTSMRQVSLGGSGATPAGVSARGAIAIVPLGAAAAVAVVDIRQAVLLRRIPLPANSGATGSAIVDDSIAYVANPNLNTVSRVNYETGEISDVEVGRYPQGVAFVRGRVFVLNGNLDETGVPAGPSWLTVIEPTTNTRAAAPDSIPLTGPGNAAFADVGGDGLLYIMSRGGLQEGEGRLSIVDPVARTELASFSGFGLAPGNLASDRESRIFVSSLTEGLLEFNADSNTVVRGMKEGVAIPSNTSVAVDSRRRVYAIESGSCIGNQPGRAHILTPTLEEVGTIVLGACPVATAVVEVPGEGMPEE